MNVNIDTNSTKFKVRLGIFVACGLALFVLGIFIIGKQKNLFNPVFKLTTKFYNISGLLVGSKVRFAGINVGTVDNIRLINDSTVLVDMLIKKEIKQFIKTDCEVGIGSEGIIGDRLLVIAQGSFDSPGVKDGQALESNEPLETDAIIASLTISAKNAELITDDLSEIMQKINNGNGTLGRLIQDSGIAENMSQTMINLKNSSRGLNENMEAAKHNFLLKGYFNKKKQRQKNR